MRPELRRILDRLTADFALTGAVSLDAIGDAIATTQVSVDEIDALIAALEGAGLTVVGPSGGGATQRLGRVVGAARALREAGERPTLAAIAARTGLSDEQVRHALALARVMQRP